MSDFTVTNTVGFSLVALTLVFILTIIWSHWIQKRMMGRLQQNGLAVFRLQPIWYLLLKFLLPKNQNFHPVVRAFQWSEGIDVIQKSERIHAVLASNSIFVHIFKPEYAEAITTSNTVINKPWIYNLIKPLVGDGLLISSGEKWRARRKLLTPAFHMKILESFMPIFNFHSSTLIRKLKLHAADSYTDVVPMVSLCTLDIIGETAMGVKINSQENENSDYIKSVVRLEELLVERMMYPWYWWNFIYYLTKKGKQCKRALTTVHEFTRKVVSERKREVKEQLDNGEGNCNLDNDSDNIYLKTKNRMAFLDLLLHRHFADGSISEEDICEEVDTFMFEGHDTTAMGISWALYNLGLYPDIQEKAYQEIQEIFGDDRERPVTVDDIRKMKYLECVIKETLRLYPPVPFIQRYNPEETNILGKTIPSKALYTISIISLHKDPDFYPNPQVFDPERFFPENAAGRHPFAYIPFSAGPRNCIGQKFALLEEKTVISTILRYFCIKSLHPRDKIVYCSELVLRPISGLHLKFTER